MVGTECRHMPSAMTSAARPSSRNTRTGLTMSNLLILSKYGVPHEYTSCRGKIPNVPSPFSKRIVVSMALGWAMVIHSGITGLSSPSRNSSCVQSPTFHVMVGRIMYKR